jgi:hypothetical protein
LDEGSRIFLDRREKASFGARTSQIPISAPGGERNPDGFRFALSIHPAKLKSLILSKILSEKS